MAIDPQIPLGIRPQQIAPLQLQTPLDRYQKMLTLRHLMQQGQLGEQRLQAGAIELEDKQRELRDQEVLRSAYMQSGGDLDVFEQLASKSGASPKSIIGIRSERLKLQLEVAKIKNEELPGRKYRNEQLSGITQGALTLPPDQYAQQWPTVRAAALAVDPKLELPLDPIPQAQLQLYGLGFATEDSLIKREEERRKVAAEKRAVATHEAELPEKQAKSLREELATAGQTAPDNQAMWDVWRGGFSKRAQGFIPAMFSPAGLQTVQKYAVPLKAAAPGVDVPFAMDVFGQKKELAIAGAPRLPSPGMTPEAEAQTIRISKATQGVKAPSGVQSKALGFYIRGKDAEDTLSALQSKMVDKNLIQQGVFKFAPNFLQSDENQVYIQAQRAFTEARLRKESGAAVPPHEYTNDAITYFPQPGDGPDVLERKRIGREKVLEGIRQEAGRAYTEYYGEEPPKAKNAPPSGGGAPQTYKHTATGQNGHKIGSNDGKTWFDLTTGKQLQ